MSRMIVATGVVLLLSGLFSSAQAQSLGDTARQEEERRQGVKAPSKVITNKDLRPAPQPSSPPPAAGGTTAAEPSKTSTSADGDATKDAKTGAKDDAKDATKADVKDQKYWRDRMKKLQDQLQRDRVYAEALQSRINALTTDFVNRDDPAQRGVVATNRQQAVDELDRLKKSIAETTKAIPALEEEARQANVPAGWLR
jgi:hypothetical protein